MGPRCCVGRFRSSLGLVLRVSQGCTGICLPGSDAGSFHASGSVAVHVNAFTGAWAAGVPYGRWVLFANFFALFPAIGLSKERNVWKNEFKTCPGWMRLAVIFICVYGLGAMIASVVVAGPMPEEAITFGAFLLGMDAIAISVLYSILWSNPIRGKELVRRWGISSLVTFLVVTVAILGRYLHS